MAFDRDEFDAGRAAGIKAAVDALNALLSDAARHGVAAELRIEAKSCAKGWLDGCLGWYVGVALLGVTRKLL